MVPKVYKVDMRKIVQLVLDGLDIDDPEESEEINTQVVVEIEKYLKDSDLFREELEDYVNEIMKNPNSKKHVAQNVIKACMCAFLEGICYPLEDDDGD